MRSKIATQVLADTTVACGGPIPTLPVYDEVFDPRIHSKEARRAVEDAHRSLIAAEHLRRFYSKQNHYKHKIVFGTRGGQPVYKKPTKKRDVFIMYAGLWLPLLLIMLMCPKLLLVIPAILVMALCWAIPFYLVKKL